ncbi:SH3 and multiple ankyrin repeat domains protein 2-like isoform X3 [Biomphalaria glabrata]|uniref:SH3 and multiple ankyrin repeat domains protein 2-like isoform X3 n=1 Tax=Biomphalaria glabrata TaxID=6526 RepID=A0A2C9MAA8_BIOGL|nr:SH3 and multiple ankyrin repeat domains protein 2-like isoform X3 [Biomphalaria glabrata]
MKDTIGSESFTPDNTIGTVFIRIAVPELKVQKCLQFQLEHTVWQAKQRVLTAFAKDLSDPLNYGMYLPPSNGKAGKFMEEERLLNEYPIQGPIGFLEFKYKRRVYKMMQINERKLKQIHSKSKLKAFMEVVRAGNIEKINKITIKGLDPNFHDPDNGETPLTTAVTLGKSKCRDVLIALVSGGSHLDFRNKQGLTALHRAAVVGNCEAIRTMLDLGASPDCKDGRDLTPLYYSVSNDDAVQECTLMLLHERARVGICDEHGWYEIHQACKHGRVQHLEHLLFYGADMDVRNSCGNTPLHICALNNQEACARVLLFRGADPALVNYSNQTADQVAAMAGNTTIADMIIAHNPEDVVPYREIPQYSNRRKGGSMTPSLRALLRTRSDPRINFAGLEDMKSPSSSSSPIGLTRRQYGGGKMIDSDSACSISVSSSSSVTGANDQGMYDRRSASGFEGYYPSGGQMSLNMRRAGSMGDVNLIKADNQHHTLATLVTVEREQHPRVVLLHRSAEGYGFVLRGAKSKIPTGGTFNDFQPSAEYPALQYLDSVDVGSQADRAGLKKGDFILEINGENVVRASHEHVVHLIRSSSNVLTLKVVTVTHADRTPADWAMHSDGSMTLPARKKQAAPLPPQRDPRTSLSYSKASSKSMTEGLEGLAEIEKLDATIAEFEGQEASRRLSLHADDPKIASIRGSHTVKRVSVVDYESLMSGEPSNAKGGDHVSPAEARIKKYHKKSASQTMERSKSTPDIISALENQYAPSYGIQTGNNLGGRGTWTKNQAPAPPSQASGYSGTLQASSVDQPYLMTAVTSGTGSYSRGSNPAIPNDASRRQANQRIAPGAPSTPELVRIHTGAKSNVRADTESPYESSFRPGASALLVDKSSLPSSEISKKNAPITDKSITFADDRVLENAQKFIQKHPNATLLVTADIHLDEPVKKGTVYEPEPDYDDSGDEKSGPPNFKKPVSNVQVSEVVKQNRAAVTVISITSEKANNKAPAPSSMHSSPSSSRRSSPLMTHMPDRTLMSGQRSSQPSSTESSRRSSIQSNMSAEGGERSGRMQMSSAPPPPPPPLVGPPPPPPPPISALLEPSFSTSGNATLARRQQAGGNEALPPRVSAIDIMAAVAERKSRLETEGPRLLEVKPISTNKTTHELNQEALKAAVALRKSRIEQTEDRTVVDEIEARLNRNKKLQAAKFVGGDVKKQIEVKKEEPNESVVSTAVSLTTTGLGANAQKPKEVVAKLESSSAVSQGKVTSVNLKPINALEKPLSTISAKESETNGTIDFRSRLKPVDVKGTTSSVVLPSKINVAPTVGNKTEVTMTNKSSKAPSPPPVKAPILSASTSVSTVSLSNKATTNSSESHTDILKSSKSGQDATSGDYIALAEKARQEYLKKKASGNLQSHIEKKGPVEITPTRKHSSPTSPTSSSPNMTSKSNGTTLIEVKPASSSGEKVNVIRSQVGSAANKNMPVKGVTEDHSHTEQSLSNGTIKKPKTNGTVSPPPGLIPPPQHGFESIVAPPPPGFDDHDGSRLKTVVLDIIPPPMSFGSSLNNSPEHGNHMPAFSQEDNASFVSSVSSLSTLSSEHGDGQNIEDLIAPPPPPPMDYDDLGDQNAFIPPPPQFLEVDSNANESQTLDKNSKPFATKSVSTWSCLDVLDWLDSLGLPQYRVSFAKACIDGTKLVDMGRNEFINLGVTQVGHRMNLERSVKKLNKPASTNL